MTKRFFITVCLLHTLALFACAPQSNKPSEGPNQSKRITASGYSKEGCLLNLKLEAREQNMRLDPDDLDVSANPLMLIFPFLNREGYQCSAAASERPKRSLGTDPIYPIN